MTPSQFPSISTKDREALELVASGKIITQEQRDHLIRLDLVKEGTGGLMLTDLAKLVCGKLR
jgi:hypothetical protein